MMESGEGSDADRAVPHDSVRLGLRAILDSCHPSLQSGTPPVVILPVPRQRPLGGPRGPLGRRPSEAVRPSLCST